MKNFLLLIIFSVSIHAHAQLIDKIVGVINEKNISLSEIKRLKKTLVGRQAIAPILYNDLANATDKSFIEHIFQTYIIGKELEKIGYNVAQERIEEQINTTLKRTNLTKNQLIEQLAKNGLSFEEYEYVIRESMEFSLFNQKIISPLIAISEQEVKSLYIQKSSQKSLKAIEYKINDYILTTRGLSETKIAAIQTQIQNLLDQNKKVKIKGVELLELGSVKSTSLDKKISSHLKNIETGKVAKGLNIAGDIHLFHVIDKDISESDEYEKVKSQIANYIFEQKSKEVLKSYFERKLQDDYFKKFL